MLSINRIKTQAEFTATWSTLGVWQYGPLSNLPRCVDDEADESDIVLMAVEDGVTVGYATADSAGIWCVEVAPEARGRGIARQLVAASGATYFCEVCSDAGAALAESMGFDFEDCR